MHIIHVFALNIPNAYYLGQWPIVRALHPDRQTTSLWKRTLRGKQKPKCKQKHQQHPPCFVYTELCEVMFIVITSHNWVSWLTTGPPKSMGRITIVENLTVDSQMDIISSSNSILGREIDKMCSFVMSGRWRFPQENRMYEQTSISNKLDW